jgi:hypothetical protein
MTLSIYDVSVPVFVRSLKAMAGVIDKAAAHADARKIDPQALLQARLFPDMFPFSRQVQIASDFAKGACARLAGADAPSYPDDEAGFEDLKARVLKTAAFLEGLDAAAFEGAEDREVVLTRRGQEYRFSGQAYLLAQAVPNFYFHAATAFDILRHNGVEIGKADFLGA